MDKTCKDCRLTKPETEFNFNSATKRARINQCKTCQHAYQRMRVKRLQRRKAIAVPLEQVCRGCHITKPAAEFSQDRGRLLGLDPRCKQCRREQYRAQRAAAEVRRRLLAGSPAQLLAAAGSLLAGSQHVVEKEKSAPGDRGAAEGVRVDDGEDVLVKPERTHPS